MWGGWAAAARPRSDHTMGGRGRHTYMLMGSNTYGLERKTMQDVTEGGLVERWGQRDILTRVGVLYMGLVERSYVY